MTPDLLRECGEALYGPQWQSALARDLQVADRTVRRWAAGDFGMPPGLGEELIELLLSRAEAIAEMQERLAKEAP